MHFVFVEHKIKLNILRNTIKVIVKLNYVYKTNAATTKLIYYFFISKKVLIFRVLFNT